MMAFCWLVRSDSSDTSKETVPLPSSMLVRRKIPASAVHHEKQLQSIWGHNCILARHRLNCKGAAWHSCISAGNGLSCKGDKQDKCCTKAAPLSKLAQSATSNSKAICWGTISLASWDRQHEMMSRQWRASTASEAIHHTIVMQDTIGPRLRW